MVPLATTDLTGTRVRADDRDTGRVGSNQGFLPKPSVIRENITGYLFITPAIFLIFIFGIFPIGYAIYMSLNVWVIQRRNFYCETPLERGGEAATFGSDPVTFFAQCFQHYQASAFGSWNGLFVAVIGFSALFVLYWFWVNVFASNKRSVRMFIGWQVALLVLAASIIVMALNSGWPPLLQFMLGAVTVAGGFWFWSNAGRSSHPDYREEDPPGWIKNALVGFTVLIGGGVLVWALISLLTATAGTLILLNNLTINALIVLYLGTLLLLGVYLLFIQDNERLMGMAVTRRIEQFVMISLRIIGLVLMANMIIAIGVAVGAFLFGYSLTWAQLLLSTYAMLILLGGLGVLFSVYVLGDRPGSFKLRGFVFLMLAIFLLLTLFGVEIRQPNGALIQVYANTIWDVAFMSVAAVFENVEWSAIVLFYIGFLLLLAAYRFWTDAFKPDTRRAFARWLVALAILTISLAAISYGWNEMLGSLRRRDQDFLAGLEITVYYAFGSIPLQLFLGLLLAYVLFQNIRGKQWYRVVFFLPYVTPAVASAVVFGRIFNGGNTSLMNSFLDSIGSETFGWVNESDRFLNVIFGFDLNGFIAGPSMALVSVIILGIWTYVGYNAVIFLAGLGGIPNDLYEAAKVDGASQWHLFRYITLPLLSPITFYLSLLGFIGTFQAFNTLFVMRNAAAGTTLDTAGLVIYDTFQKETKYGEAAAQAIVLFIAILILTQLQRNVFEKRVFYG